METTVHVSKDSYTRRTFKNRLVLIVDSLIYLFSALFIYFRLRNAGYLKWTVMHNSPALNNSTLINPSNIRSSTQSKSSPIKVPWRFHIEDDGFVFPLNNKAWKKYITYDPLHTTWSKQLIEFENAVIFAYILKRTLLVPPLLPYYSAKNWSKEYRHQHVYSLSKIINFKTLSRLIPLKETETSSFESFGNMTVYNVCHDPRLGFWVDYLPANDNIQTWRELKQQMFTPFPYRISNEDMGFICEGTENYRSRWGPPLKIKPSYRGILSELYNTKEDIIRFRGDTLDTKDIRFFDKQRSRKAQEILIFHIRFSEEISQAVNYVSGILGQNYDAILSGPIQNNTYFQESVRRSLFRFQKRSKSPRMLIVCEPGDQQKFQFLSELGFSLIFWNDLVLGLKNFNVDHVFFRDVAHLCSLLLCAYAANFIGIHTSADLFYVEHLRLQNTTIKDGLLIDKISVRWAKHMTRSALEEAYKMKGKLKSLKEKKAKKAKAKKQKVQNGTASHGNVTKKPETGNRTTTKKKKRDKLDNIVCSFCSYIKHVTGQHACPTLVDVCA